MFGWDLAEGHLSHLNNSERYYGTKEGKIVLEELYKLRKQYTTHLKEMHQRNGYMDHQIENDNLTFEVGQSVMVRNHACHTFEPKFQLDYWVLQIPYDNTVLLVTPDGKERKWILMMSNHVAHQN